MTTRRLELASSGYSIMVAAHMGHMAEHHVTPSQKAYLELVKPFVERIAIDRPRHVVYVYMPKERTYPRCEQ